MKCSKCGAELANGAKFCSACGASVLPEPEVEVIPPADEPKVTKSKEDKEIEKLKRELAEHRRREKNFRTAGLIVLFVGIFVTVFGIIGLILLSLYQADTVDPNGGVITGIVFSALGVSFGSVAVIVSIPLLVVSVAVFGKKAENRERAIQEFESNK